MKFNLYNKSILITGASGGLGGELAELLVNKYRCTVVGTGRNEKKLQDLRDKLGDDFSYKIMDVRCMEDWLNLAEQLKSENHMPDVLINNAGILPQFTRFGKYSQEEVKACIDANLNSVLYSAQIFTSLFASKEGTAIINISSSDALCPLAGTSLYSAGKAAVKALSEAMREEYRGRIYVPTVCPGFIRTDIMCGQRHNDNNIIDKVSMPANKAAAKILKQINRGKDRIVIGADAHLMSASYRIAPVLSQRFFNFIFKFSKLNLFSEIYK